MSGTGGVPGEVVAVRGSRAVVRVRRHGACGRTHQCPWDVSFQLLPGAGYVEVEAVAEGDLAPGDTVLVSTASRHVTKAWLLGFGLPLAGALAGAAAGAWLLGTDLGAAAGMGAGLVAAWWTLRHISRRLAPAPFRAVRYHGDPCAGVCPLAGGKTD